MRPTHLFAVAALPVLSLLSPVSASAQWVEVSVLTEYIELDERAATKLQRQHRGQRDMSPLRDALQEMVDGGDAKVVATCHLRTRPGSRARVEAGDEITFPTVYDPPEIAQELVGPLDEDVVITTPANPTRFDTRRVGARVEVDPAISTREDVIELNVSARLTSYLGEKAHGKDESLMVQPVFYTLDTSTAVSLVPGEYALLAVHTPHKGVDEAGNAVADPTRRVLLFVRAKLLVAPNLQEKGGEE